MLNSDTLARQQDSSAQTISLKLILELPKRCVIGEVLVCLIMLTGVRLTPIGKLTGFEGDRFNWCYVEMTGIVSDLIQAAIYLKALSVKVKVTEIKLDWIQ